MVKPIPEWSLTEKVNGHTNESSQELRASEKKRLEESQTMLVSELVKVIDSTRFSSWKKLVHVTAYVLRYIHNLRKKDNRKGELSIDEIKEAEMYWVRYLQDKLQAYEKYSQLETQFQIFRDNMGILRA